MKRHEDSPAAGRCPCGRAADYGDCCGRWHAGVAVAEGAPDAETLMRSRYSAFVLKRVDYLLATWHPSTRPTALNLDDEGATRWLGLEVRDHHRDSADRARVEFVARCKQGGRATRLHEISRFVREDGRWFYLDGDINPG